MNRFAVAIFGPTGVGKTSLAVEIAGEIGEIISVDSMQVYKQMNIGTAKPESHQLEKVKHHLIDILTPDEQFSAGQFVQKADILIKDIFDRDKIPFLVGGTGLYFSSLINGIADIPKAPLEVREAVLKKWGQIGQSRMYEILKRIDPVYAAKIHSNDRQRTLRALEVFLTSKKRFSEYHQKSSDKHITGFLKIGIKLEREKLYELINKRVDDMLSSGLVDEVKGLLSTGYSKDAPGMRAIGYKEIISYLEHKITFEEAVSEIKKNSRHYAKRQFTWFNAMDDVKWFDVSNRHKIKEYILDKIDRGM